MFVVYVGVNLPTTSRCSWSISKHLYRGHLNLLIGRYRWKRLKTKKFSCLKKTAIALLSTFGFTCLYEQIFSHTEDHSEPCIQRKDFNICPNIAELSKDKDNTKKQLLTVFDHIQ